MPLLAARLAGGILLAALAGASFLPRPAKLRTGDALDWLALAVTLGLALITPLVLLVGILGLPVAGGSIAAIAATLAIAGRSLGAARPAAEPMRPDAGGPRLWLSRIVLLAALAAFCLKIALVPVWSWDHYLVWGMKARRLLDGGFLDLGFLNVPPFTKGNPDYPLGLPILWRVLTLGGEPSTRDFKALHVVAGFAVVCLVRLVLRRAGASRFAANVVAVFVAISPLFWDTESLGLADMPLCAASLGAVSLVLCLRRDPSSRLGFRAGVLLGFLPWIKREGLWLALLLFGAAWLAGRARARRPHAGWAAAAISFAVVAGGTLLLQWLALPRGLPFLAGHWFLRIEHRAPYALWILRAMGADLLAADWLGFWLVSPFLIALAVRRRAYDALVVVAVVLGQMGLYAFTYLGTYVNPLDHIDSSFYRLMAALLPLAAVGLALSTQPGLGADQPAGSRPERVFQ